MMDRRKIIGTIIGIILFAITVVSITYAYYSWRSSNTDVTFNIDDSYFFCETDLDSSISSLAPTNDYRNGTYQVFNVNNIGRSDTTFSLSMNITSISDVLKDESFKYKLMLDPTNGSKNCASTSESGCTLVGEGNFSQAHVGMNTLVQSINLPNNSRYRYYFFMYLDGTMNNPTDIQSGTMTSSLGVCDIYVTFDANSACSSVSPTFKKLTVDQAYGPLPTPTNYSATITYNTNGGSAVSNSVVNYVFGGWFKTSDANALAQITAVTANSSYATTQTTIVQDVENHILKARWHDVNGKAGETSALYATLPSAPTKSGYTFTGWYTDSGLNNLAGQPGDKYTPGCNTTLYAGWDANEVVVNINKDSSAWTSSNPGVNVALYQSGTLKYAYSNGTVSSNKQNVTWNGVAAGTYDVYVSKDANHLTDLVDSSVDVTISNNLSNNHKTVTTNMYTLTVKTSNTTVKVNDTSVNNNGTLVVLGGTTSVNSNYGHDIVGTPAVGYTFSSWSNNGTVSFGSSSSATTTAKVASAATITATSVASTYTVKFATGNNNCSLGNDYADIIATYGSSIKSSAIANPTCTGYIFDGWTASGDFNISTAKRGTSASAINTSWTDGSVKVSDTFFKNLSTTNSGTVTLTANWRAGNYQNMTTNISYEFLKDALSAASSGDTIKVLNGITETTSATVASGKNIKIDMNGKTTTMNGVYLTNSGTLDIYSSSGTGTFQGQGDTLDRVIDNQGTFTTNKDGATNPVYIINKTANASNYSVIYNNTGMTATLYSNTIVKFDTAIVQTASYRYVVRNYGDFNLNGATIENTITNTTYERGIANQHANGKIVINSGTVTTSGIAVWNTSGTTSTAVEVKNGTIRSNINEAIQNGNATGTIIINGGNISAASFAVFNYSSGTINISGGTISNTTAAAVNNRVGGVIDISGGEFSATTTSAVYNVGGSDSSGTINISGGKFSTTSGVAIQNHGAKSVMTISGGDITSTSSFGVRNQSTGTLNVSGGSINGTIGVYSYSNGEINITDDAYIMATTNEGVRAYTGKVTISGGHVESTGASGDGISLTTGTVTVTGGTVVGKRYGVYANGAGTFTMGENSGTPSITVPEIKSTGTSSGNGVYAATAATFNFYDGKIVARANSTINYVNKTDEDINVPSGYFVLKTTENNIETAILSNTQPVARIGNSYYTSIASAVAAVPTNHTETTIVLLKNHSENVAISGNKNIILDLDGYTLSNSETGNSFTLDNASTTFKITNGTVNSSMDVINNTNASVIVDGAILNSSATTTNYTIRNSGGSVTVSSGTVSSDSNNAIYNTSSGTVTVSDGLIKTLSDSGAAFYNDSGTVTITGGTITYSDTNTYYVFENHGILNMTDGNVTGVAGGGIGNAGGVATISGGTISTKKNAVYNTSSGTVIVNDGFFQVTDLHTILNRGSLTVNGGTLTRVSTSCERGVIYNYASGTVNVIDGNIVGGGVGIANVGGTLVVSGGTISSDLCNSIVNDSSGTLTIGGGTISSISKYAVYNLSSSTVMVNGGLIQTTNANTFGNVSGSVTINGGTITTDSDTNTYTVFWNQADGILNMINGNIIGFANVGLSNEGSATISGGTISAVSRTSIYNSSSSAILTISGGLIQSETGVSINNNGTVTMNGGTMTTNSATNTNAVFGNQSSGTLNMTNGNIVGISNVGFYNLGGNATISGGNISSVSSDAVYSGTINGTTTITGGTISGGRHGINIASGTVTLGTNDGGTPSITSPSIISSSTNTSHYGVYRDTTNGTVNFYDGIITARDGGTLNDDVNDTPDGYVVVKSTSGTIETAILGPARTITLKAGDGVSDITLAGWTGTGTGTLTKTYSEGSVINLGSASITNYTGYHGSTWSKTSGQGTLSGTSFTVGAGSATLTVVGTANTYQVIYQGIGGDVDELSYEWDAFYNDSTVTHVNIASRWPAIRQASRIKASVARGSWGADYLLFNNNSVDTDLTFSTGVTYPNFSVEAVLSFDSVTGTQYIISNRVADNTSGFSFMLSSGHLSFIACGTDGGSSNCINVTDTSLSLEANKKYHVAGVFNSGTVTLYVNGEAVKTQNISYAAINGSSSRVFVGCPLSSINTCDTINILSGKIYSFAINSSNRTAEQIASSAGKVVTYKNTYGDLASPERVGYTFGGWHKTTELSGSVTSSSTVTDASNHSLYAKWNPISYTISFDSNEENCTLDSTTYADISANFGTAYNVTVPTCDGYTFSGWTATNLNTTHALRSNISSNFAFGWDGTVLSTNTYYKNLAINSGSVVIMTANWVNNNKVTIAINKDGSAYSDSGMKVSVRSSATATSDILSTTVSSGSSATLTSNGSNILVSGNTYYVFMGKDQNHKTDMVYSGVTFTGSASATATINYYSLKVDKSPSDISGNATVNGTNVTLGNSVIVAGGSTTVGSNYAHVLTIPTVTGYTFYNWSSSGSVAFVSATTTASNSVRVASAATITANYRVHNYQNMTTNATYETLASALNAASSGHTIKVLNGVTETTSATVASGKDIKLDMNGKTTTLNGVYLTNSGTLDIYSSVDGGVFVGNSTKVIDNSGKLTINGTSAVHTVSVNNYSTSRGVISNSSSLIVNNNSTITGSVSNLSSGSAVINGGLIQSNIKTFFNSGNVTLSGGIIKSSSSNYSVFENSSGTVTMSGGTIMSDYDGYRLTYGGVDNDSVFNMSGGVISTVSLRGLVNLSSNSIFTIDDGIISSVSNDGILNSSSLYINGGLIKSADGHAFYSNLSGTVTMSGGTITTDSATNTSAALYINRDLYSSSSSIPRLYMSGGIITGTAGNGIENSNGVVTITGGTVTGGQNGIMSNGTVTLGNNEGGIPSITNPSIISNSTDTSHYGVRNNNGTLRFYDGIITARDGGTLNVTPNSIPDGYVVSKTTENGRETAILSLPPVARIGSVNYTSIASAVAAVPTNHTETTIVLLRDHSENVTITGNKNIVLNLNGHVLSNSGTGNSFTLSNASTTFKITNGTVNSSMDVINNSSASVIVDGATLNSSATTNNYTIRNSGGSVTINSGTVSSDSKASIYNSSSGSIAINGGLIKSTSGTTVHNIGQGNITMSGGTVTTASDSNTNSVFYTSSGTLNMIGGNIVGLSGKALFNTENSTVSISAGTISSVSNNAVHNTGSMTINGGLIKSTSTSAFYSAGAGSVITMNGGIITTDSDTNTSDVFLMYRGSLNMLNGNIIGKAGIALRSNVGSVIVGDGTISSVSNYAIKNDSSATITVNGGVISSTSNDSFLNNGSATIIGGTITGGMNGINIIGGTVTLGNDDGGTPSITSPSITSSSTNTSHYGVSRVSSGVFNFYDGIIRARDGGTLNRDVSDLPDDYFVVKTTVNNVETAVLKKVRSITLKAGDGVGSLTLAGWTGSGTGTLTSMVGEGDTIDLSTVSVTNVNGYSGTNWSKTSGQGILNGNLFTVGAGSATLTVTGTANNYFVHYDGNGGDHNSIEYEWDAYWNNGNSHSDSVTSWLNMNSTISAPITNGTWSDDYLQFNGTNSWVNTGIKFPSNVSSFSIECTFMLDSIQSGEVLLVSNFQSGGVGLGFQNGKPKYQVYVNGTGWKSASYDTVLTTGVKYHMAGTYDGTNIILYLNGVEVARTTFSGIIKAPTNNTVMGFGCNPSGNSCSGPFLNGKIYNAAFLNDVRSAADIALAAGKNVTYNSSYGTLPTPAREGYSFIGWYTGSGTRIQSSDVVSTASDHTLYARWNPYNYQNVNTGIYYDTLSSALSAANNDDTIKVFNGITESISATVTSGKSVKIDMNGKTTTLNAVYLTNSGTLDIYSSVAGGVLQGNAVKVIDNYGTLTINSTSSTNTVSITNTTAANSVAVSNHSSFTVNNNSMVNASSIAVDNASSSTFTLVGGLIQSSNHNALNSSGTVTMSGGTISSSSQDNASVYNGAGAIFNMSNGVIIQTGNHAGINNYGSATVSGGTVSSNSMFGVYNRTNTGNFTLQGGLITSGSSDNSSFLNESGAVLTMTSGSITQTGTYAPVNNYGNISMSGGKISSSTLFGLYNRNTGTVTMLGGTITTTSASNTSSIFNNEAGGVLNMSNGVITSSAGNGLLNNGMATITGGTISGGRHGINVSSGTVTLGNNDGGVPITTSPSIISSSTSTSYYGVYRDTTNGTFNFYDGVITARDNGTLNDDPSSVPNDYIVWKTTNDNRETAILSLPPVARIGNSDYLTVAAAVAAVPTDGTQTTIVLLRDQTENVTITGNRNIILDLDGYTLNNSGTGSTFTLNNAATIFKIINGTVNSSRELIKNTNASVIIDGAVMTSSYSNRAAINNTGGNITVSSGSIGVAFRVVDNSGSFIVNGGTLTIAGSSIAINNNSSGTVTVNGGYIESARGRPIDNYGGIVTISGGTLTTTANYTVNNSNGSGYVTINGGFITSTGRTIANSGTVVINDGLITSTAGYAIYNTGGTLSIIDGTISSGTSDAIFNTNAILSITDGTINSGTSAAINNNSSGSVTIDGGLFESTSGRTINNNGTVTINSGTISSGSLHALFNSSSGSINIINGLMKSTSGTSVNNQGIITLGGGTITSGTNTSNKTIFYNASSGTLNMTNGNIIGAAGKGLDNSGTASISGGTISSVSGHAITNGSSINISGGLIKSTSAITFYSGVADSNITVSGGTITTDSDTNTKSVFSVYRGTLNITNGNIIGIAGKALENTIGIVTMNGGTISSVSNYAVQNYINGNITVNGGLIKSTSNNSVYNSGSITLAGGTVTTDSNTNANQVFYNYSGILNMTNGNIIGINGDALSTSSGTITINDGTISSVSYNAIRSVSSGNVTINGGLIKSSSGCAFTNYGSTSITGGLLESTSYYSIYNSGTSSISGGTITTDSDANTYSVFYNSSGTLNMTNGNIIGIGGIALYNDGGNITIDDGSVNSVNSAVYNSSGSLGINGGLIKSTSHRSITNNSTISLTGGTITTDSDTNTVSVFVTSSGTLNMTNGNIVGRANIGLLMEDNSASSTISGGTISSVSNYALSDRSSGSVSINGGLIKSTSSDGMYVYNTSTGSITGGTITGGRNGINIVSGTVTLGDNDGGVPSTTSPSITSTSTNTSYFGINRNATNGVLNFYDGIITARNNGTLNSNPNSIPSGYRVNKTISGNSETAILTN